jgi:hypothetical protein
MTPSQELREHALAGSDIYDSQVFNSECWRLIHSFKSSKEELNQDQSPERAAIVCLYILFCAEALENPC